MTGVLITLPKRRDPKADVIQHMNRTLDRLSAAGPAPTGCHPTNSRPIDDRMVTDLGNTLELRVMFSSSNIESSKILDHLNGRGQVLSRSQYEGRAALAPPKKSEYRYPGFSPFCGRVARMASTMGGGPLA